MTTPHMPLLDAVHREHRALTEAIVFTMCMASGLVAILVLLIIGPWHWNGLTITLLVTLIVLVIFGGAAVVHRAKRAAKAREVWHASIVRAPRSAVRNAARIFNRIKN